MRDRFGLVQEPCETKDRKYSIRRPHLAHNQSIRGTRQTIRPREGEMLAMRSQTDVTESEF